MCGVVGHAFPQTDLGALTERIAKTEELDALIALRIAVMDQIKRHQKRTPAEIAAAVGESPERIADLLHEPPFLRSTRD